MRTIITLVSITMLLFASAVAIAQDTTDYPRSKEEGSVMKIKIASISVDDQEKADVPVGDYRWLTAVSPEDSNGAELLLEPNDNPAAAKFKEAMFEQGIPATVFFVEDIHETFDRLKKQGVEFTLEPTDAGTTIIAVFDDTCGSLI